MPRAVTLLPPPPIESIPALFAVLTPAIPRVSEVRELSVDLVAWDRRTTDVDELMQSSDSWPDDYPTWPIEESLVPPGGFQLTPTYGW